MLLLLHVHVKRGLPSLPLSILLTSLDIVRELGDEVVGIAPFEVASLCHR